jgi:hypothetical protein
MASERNVPMTAGSFAVALILAAAIAVPRPV